MLALPPLIADRLLARRLRFRGVAPCDAAPSVPRLLPREFVFRIEQAVIETLATYNCVGERKAGAPGIYVAEGELRGAKIAALGLKIRANGCTYHGVSLNVALDLQPFEWINPCGYPGLATIDLRSLGVNASLSDVQDQLARALEQQLMP